MTQLLHQILRKLGRHGAIATLHVLAMRALNAFVECKILRGVCVEEPDATFLHCPAHYAAEFVTPARLREFARDPANEMSQRFLDEALARGDQCFALRDGGSLAAYGWYSSGPTPVNADLELRFDRHYVYMYKGFTGERYRGQRLHAIGMTKALEHYRAAGYKGLVSYVESTNYDSLKSCFRMGYRVFGSIYMMNIAGRLFNFSSSGCTPFGFRVVRNAKAIIRPVVSRPA